MMDGRSNRVRKPMPEVWNNLRIWLWPVALGVALGAAAMALDAWAAWAVLLLACAGALAVRVLAPEPLRPEEQVRHIADPTRAVLPPLVRAVIEQLPAPVMLLDGAQRVLFANDSMHAVVGPGVERKHVSAVLRNPFVIEAIRETAATGEAGAGEFSLPVPIERFYQAYTARVSADPPVVALLLHDVTAIRRSEQMRADFVANASHELRTPLAAVSGFIDTLRGHARDDADARERFLEIMSVEAARMRRLIDDLLSLTRIELNEHVRPETRVPLEGIVRQAAQALEPLAAGDGITIKVINRVGGTWRRSWATGTSWCSCSRISSTMRSNMAAPTARSRSRWGAARPVPAKCSSPCATMARVFPRPPFPA